MPLNTLDDLYQDKIRSLHSAEAQILEALPKMAAHAAHPELQAGFAKHLEETREHLARLETIAARLGIDPRTHPCVGMRGLMMEGTLVMSREGDPAVRDAALIAAAQAVEHYEMAAYGCARTYAEALGREDDAALLQQTLDNESETDEALTDLTETIVNLNAAAASS